MTKHTEAANKNIAMNTVQGDVMEGNKIQIYQTADGKTQIDVRMEKDTLWLPLAQIVELFGRDQSIGLCKMPQFELLQKLHQFKREQQASQAGSLVSLVEGNAAP